MFPEFSYHVILRANYETTVCSKKFSSKPTCKFLTNIQVTHRDFLVGVTVPCWVGFLANPSPRIIWLCLKSMIILGNFQSLKLKQNRCQFVLVLQ